ncbi:MAG: phosphoribosylanthranilate isomerase, partial [Cyanobium sp. MAG_237]|nr:phosphoribosylanthranilate isomerase [Cyanobium sp. MAG_237]
MAPPLLKICGLRDPAQAAAVAQLGVDAIGVIGVPGSPRFLEAEQRPALFAAMRAAAPGCRGVLVVADPLEQQWPQLELGQGHA